MSNATMLRGPSGIGDAPRVRETREVKLTATDCVHTYRCDAIALDNEHKLLYLSVAGSSTSLKALRAVLAQPKEAFKLHTTDYEASPYPRDYMQRDGDGYQSYSTALGLGTWQMVLVSKRKGFMPCISEEAVWQEIGSSNYTTPLLREWAKPIYERMLTLPRLLRKCNVWGCECGLLDLKDSRLDQLVLDLLRDKVITIGGHVVEVPRDIVPCPSECSNGYYQDWRGDYTRKCYNCDGHGMMEKLLDGEVVQLPKDYKPKAAPKVSPVADEETVTCEECNGDGAIDNDTICHACNGSGTK